MKRGRETGWLIAALFAVGCSTSTPVELSDNGMPARTSTPASSTTVETTPPVTEPTTPRTTLPPEPLDFLPGRNDYELRVEGETHEFVVHVPSGYDPAQPTALVVAFHDESATGPSFYEGSGWVQKAESENIILAFPTALRYFMADSDKAVTKWNHTDLRDEVKVGTTLYDDVRFVRSMLASIQATWTIDPRRIFATGFANGADFVTSRLQVDMDDVFAATASSGGIEAPSHAPTNGVDVPMYIVQGTDDDRWLSLFPDLAQFPLNADAIFDGEPFGTALQATRELAGQTLDHTVQYCNGAGTICTATYDPAYEQAKAGWTTLTFGDPASDVLVFQMVKNLRHAYPKLDNNPEDLVATDLFWDFFVRHPKD